MGPKAKLKQAIETILKVWSRPNIGGLWLGQENIFSIGLYKLTRKYQFFTTFKKKISLTRCLSYVIKKKKYWDFFSFLLRKCLSYFITLLYFILILFYFSKKILSLLFRINFINFSFHYIFFYYFYKIYLVLFYSVLVIFYFILSPYQTHLK